MAKKKSNAQIARMKKRAEARGEEYVYIAPPEDESPLAEEGEHDTAKGDKKIDAKKLTAARKLRQELDAIEANETLKSKDRRSAKRKAEAIAAEEAGCSAEDLLSWYEEHGRAQDTGRTTKKDKKKDGSGRKNPYIVFVGQLSYDTTSEGLFQHIKNELGKEHEVTKETVKIRLLTDAKTKKSRGMAFVETSDPELLYACLKLHHTHLEGRRINVERTAGGGKNSEARKTKLSQMRKDQEKLMSETVDKMLTEHLSSGELQEKELDDGVIALCKRHSPAIVEAALVEYIEKGGRDLDNPSAYLTFLIGKMATEGIDDPKDKKERKERRAGGNDRRSGGARQSKRPRHHHASNSAQTELGVIGSKLQNASTFAQAGVDMSASNALSKQDMSKIFPSMRRGRGRGYM